MHGLRCNPNKLLLDPYAKAIEGNIDGDESLFSYWFKSPDDTSAMNDLDSAAHTMKSDVVEIRISTRATTSTPTSRTTIR